MRGRGGRKDIQIFDFSTKVVCSKMVKILGGEEEEKKENKLFVGVVGDALLEPFWPLGTGANRAILSALDVGWVAGKYWGGEGGERGVEEEGRKLMGRLMESGEGVLRGEGGEVEF